MLCVLMFPGAPLCAADAPPSAPKPATAPAPAPAAANPSSNSPPPQSVGSARSSTNRPPRVSSRERSRFRHPAGDGIHTNRPPHLLGFDTIVRLVYDHNPTVRAAREEMEAAKHGLVEFRANLSRFEPYVEVRSDLSDFPHRREAFGNVVETVVGVKKETFEGSVLSLETGGAYSRFDFDAATAGLPNEESGGGALVRARVEMPFFGSRRRQDRIISQAFQESTARKAQLDYLKTYNSVVDNALEYYNEAVYYQRLFDIYQRYSEDLAELAEERRLKPEDRARVEGVKGSAETTRNIYQTRRLEDGEILRAYLALAADQQFEIQIPDYRLSDFLAGSEQPDHLPRLLQRARENNPTFTVLEDARRNAELKRRRAIRGRYDVTAFLEGTTFPIGSATYDNRYEGWTVGGGVNVRLNDRRVLEASRLKAEAEIRQFEAQIEAENLLVRRRINTETLGLLENDRNRNQMQQVFRQKTAEFRQRLEGYFVGQINIDQLLDTRAGLTSSEVNLAANSYGSANRESRLMLATGRAYELVGLQVRSTTPADDTDDAHDLPPSKP